MLVTTGEFWEQILRLWHIFGVKSHLGVWAFVSHYRIKFALDYRPKVGKNAQYYMRVLRKNVCGSFWDQNRNWLSNKKVEKMLDIIFAFWEKNGEGEVVEKMLDVIGVFNIFFCRGASGNSGTLGSKSQGES